MLDSDPSVRASPTTHACIEVCTAEAANIVQLLKLYDTSFSVRQAPYLLSYATYVAATIHVRLASASRPGSTAHQSLAACLTVLDLNSKTNPAVRKASVVIEALMKAMNVNVDEPMSSGTTTTALSTNGRASPAVALRKPSAGMSEATHTAHTPQHPAGAPTMTYDPQGMLHPSSAATLDDGSGAYNFEPGSEYFGDFGAFGMDDILFGFNASESIFQDFM